MAHSVTKIIFVLTYVCELFFSVDGKYFLSSLEPYRTLDVLEEFELNSFVLLIVGSLVD